MILKTLGGLRLQGARFNRPKPLALLAYLALEGAKERRHLAELFWSRAANPRSSLTTALHQLRNGVSRVLDVDEMWVSTGMKCDAKVLLSDMERGTSQRVLELYRGPFLAGFDVEGIGVELEEWIYGTREHLAQLFRKSLLDLAEERAVLGELKRAASYAERAYALQEAPPPEPDELTRTYALLLAGDHPRVEVLRKEASEVGLTLSFSTDEIRERFRQGVSAEMMPEPPHNLPVIATSFVGRDQELIELGEYLSSDERRLVSLVGTAGVGKTRLALRLAQDQVRLRAFGEGVFFVALDALFTPDLIPTRIAGVLGVELGAANEPLNFIKRSLGEKHTLLVLDNFEQLVEGAGLVSELLEACANLKLLVTSRERLSLVEEWVYEVEGLAVPEEELANLGEQEHEEALQLFVQRARSADLRFAVTSENLAATARICRLLEGSPLGIELAAAWVRLFTPGEIAEEIFRNLDFLASPIRNIPERHRSLRAAFEHSWKLLSAKEQEILRKLSAFRGGFRREAAQEVAGASIPVLASLVDKSLMRVLPGGRFDRHPLMYQFTQEKLAEHPAERVETLDRHLRYFLRVAEEIESKLTGVDQDTWLDALQEEHDNIRAALDWSEEFGKVELGLAISSAIMRFWLVRGHLREGREHLEALLALPHLQVANRVRAKALDALGTILPQMGAWPQASEVLKESLAIGREVEDWPEVATALNNLGWTVMHLSDFSAATDHSEEALSLHRELGNARGVAVALNNLGWIAMLQGEFRDASRDFEESLALRRDLGNPRGIAFGTTNLAWVQRHLGEYVSARALAEEGEIINRRLGDDQMLGYSCCLLGMIAFDHGDIEGALRLLEEGIEYFRKTDSKFGMKRYLKNLAEVLWGRGERERAGELLEEMIAICSEGQDLYFYSSALLRQAQFAFERGELGTARKHFCEGLGIKSRIGDKHGIAKFLAFRAEVLLLESDWEGAVRFYAASADLRRRIEAPTTPRIVTTLDRKLETVKSELGEAAFKASLSAGESMTLEEVIALA